MTEQWIGRTLSKVRIQELVGRGGMAEVYLGMHTTLNRPVAVKVLHGHLSEDPELQRRFMAEAQAVAALRHPNIVQVFDFDIADSRPYIVMELLQGMSLAEYLRGLHVLGTTLPLETVGRLLDGLCAALDYAHDRGIVHRDIKPANVILRQSTAPLKPGVPLPDDVEPVLTDFGLARITGSTTQTMSGTILGTPAYMSPEQVRGEAADARSDNYSLGIMLYEMLAGELPFDPQIDTTASVLYKQVHQTPPPLANTSPALQMVVGRALDKDRSRRYQRAGDLARDFHDALRPGATLLARPPEEKPAPVTVVTPSPTPTPAPSATAPERIRWWAIGGGVAALLCLTGAVLVRASGLLASGPRPVPVSTTTRSSPSGALTPLAAALPTATQETGLAGTPAGAASLRDSSLQVTLADVPSPPPGFVYAAWLIADDGTTLGLGTQETGATSLTISFADSEARNLAAQYRQVAISLEPDPDPNPEVAGQIVYRGEVPPEVAELLELLDSLTRGQPSSQAFEQGAPAQAGVIESHKGFSTNAVADGNPVGAKQHAEHSINASAGEGSPEFADWDGNGNTQNPGDDFGLMRYLELYQAMVEAEAVSPFQSEERRAALSAFAAEVEALRTLTEDLVSLAQRIASSDTVEEMQPLAEQLSAISIESQAAQIALRASELSLNVWLDIFPVR
ncbi:MAG TPA: protein kinase [Anaerolineales bacterium]|nr:protein kinase [Anaerolineales bacterium]